MIIILVATGKFGVEAEYTKEEIEAKYSIIATRNHGGWGSKNPNCKEYYNMKEKVVPG